MKKLFAILTVLSLVFVLAACGDKEESKSNKLVVGATNVPHAEILEKAKPILKKEGIELVIKKFNDYVLPNKFLSEKELDANYFQHIPYFNLQVKENNYKFTNAGGIHIEPIGVYSKKYKKLEDLPKGAEIIMSSSVSDHGRILSMLEAKGLITLKDGIEKTAATVEDIVKNEKELKFTTNIEPALLTRVYNNGDGDAVLINSNYALDAGLNPMEDAITLEDSESPYVNIVAVRSGDEDKEAIKTLVEVLRSKEIQDWIITEYGGAVVPVSE
jgi:D-methionine transport system substrate-binding protein